MNSYPYHHSHAPESRGHALRPVCAYCLSRLGTGPITSPLSSAMRRELEEHHECIEKSTARQPKAALPFN